MVSVIIPTYNREASIRRSIESVLNQTYTDLELIVVDDGSVDGTAAVVKAIDDPRLRYVYQPNGGAGAARNRGMELAKGDYIAFQDSDDVWRPDKLRKQMEYLMENDYDFIGCGFERVNEARDSISSAYAFTLQNILTDNRVSTQTVLMKREIASRVRFDEAFNKLEDWDFLIQVRLADFRIGFLEEILVDAYYSDNSITLTVNSEKALLYIAEKYKDVYDRYPSALSVLYMNIARSFRGRDRAKSQEYLRKSFALHKSPKTLAKLILNPLGLWKA